MLKRFFIYILLLFVFCCSYSCSCDKQLQRVRIKCPHLFEKELVSDTFIIKDYQMDTSFILNKQIDTFYIDNERVSIKLIKKKDTLYSYINIPADTIIKTIEVEKMIINKKPPHYMNKWIKLFIGGFLLVTIIYIYKKIKNKQSIF